MAVPARHGPFILALRQRRAMHAVLQLFLLIAAPLASIAGEKSDAERAGLVALTFINSYVKASDSRGWDSLKWVCRSPVATEHFKRALAKLYGDALKTDPEVGYDADAVISGNGCPDHFNLKSSKVSGEKAHVVLIGSQDFPKELNVALVKSGKKWLVDGSGVLAK